MGIVVDSSLWFFVLHGSHMNALNVKKRNFFFLHARYKKLHSELILKEFS